VTLHRQLTCRREHDDARLGLVAALCAVRETLQHRDHEGSRLTGASHGAGDDVLAGKRQRDRAGLDGRRRVETHGAESAQQRPREAQSGEARRLVIRRAARLCSSLGLLGEVGGLARLLHLSLLVALILARVFVRRVGGRRLVLAACALVFVVLILLILLI
jgi:hypothetical protein